MRLAFIWWFDRASEIYPLWRDGLRAALEVIEKEHTVIYFFDKKIPVVDDFDFILLWGDAQCEALNYLSPFTCRKGICLSALPQDYRLLKNVDVIYCESNPIYEAVRAQGLHVVRAFGTDDKFFSPDMTVEKDIDYFYPATFSPWKKQSSISYLGDALLCVGTVQPDGVKELESCQAMGVTIKQGYFPAETIRDYYRRTKKVIIPAVHGSERTVLEAMSMDIEPSVLAEENVKARSYLEEYHNSIYTSPREFIIHYYSAQIYAERLLKGMYA